MEQMEQSLGYEQPSEDEVRISRRLAMKAALGGGVAAAAFLAPSVEGFSIVPDYAAAASCTSPTPANLTRAADDCNGVLEIGCCWGNVSSGNCTCGAQPYNLSASPFSLTGNITGDCNSDNGAVNFAVSGIDPPFQQCTVSVSGVCSGNSGAGNVDWRSTNTIGDGTTFSQTFNTNGSGSTLTDCNGNLVSFANQANLSITLNCVCNNTANS